MKRRWVILPIDDITAILRDYASQIGFPGDAVPITWMLHPASQKIALVVEAESFVGNQPTEEIKFQLKQTLAVGGGE